MSRIESFAVEAEPNPPQRPRRCGQHPVADAEIAMRADGAAPSSPHQPAEARDGKGIAGNGRHPQAWSLSDQPCLRTAPISGPAAAKHSSRPVRRQA